MFDAILNGIREIFGQPEEVIPLHAPWFDREDEEAVAACVRSTYVSSVGAEINAFEKDLCSYTGAAHAVAVVNGTAALHAALILAEVGAGDLILTQAFTFIATCNAITYTGATPVFIDIDRDTLGLSPEAVLQWLSTECELKQNDCIHRGSGKRVKACIPMHSFGTPMRILELLVICNDWNIVVIEDAAEALGSTRGGQHAGTFASIGILSFNGNKIITSGGGGALLLKEEPMFRLAKHLTTQAKVPHPWAFSHDRIGYNYRMPNLNAALARSQLKKLKHNIRIKQNIHDRYRTLFSGTPWELVTMPHGTKANHWLNAVAMRDEAERDAFLDASNGTGIQTRPVWDLATEQPMYRNALQADLAISREMQSRLVNLPSSAHQ